MRMRRRRTREERSEEKNGRIVKMPTLLSLVIKKLTPDVEHCIARWVFMARFTYIVTLTIWCMPNLSPA